MEAQPDVVICGRDTVWLHCQHSPATSACCQYGHDCGDRIVRCPGWETGEFILLQTQVDTTQRGDLDSINESKRNVLFQYKVRQPKTYFAQNLILKTINCVSGGVCHP